MIRTICKGPLHFMWVLDPPAREKTSPVIANEPWREDALAATPEAKTPRLIRFPQLALTQCASACLRRPALALRIPGAHANRSGSAIRLCWRVSLLPKDPGEQA